MPVSRSSESTVTEIDTVVALRVALGRIHRQLRGRAATEMTQSQLSALVRVESNGPLRLGDLADVEGIAAASMSRIVDALVASGFVVRASDLSDGRVSRIDITTSGSHFLREARTRSTDALLSAFRALPSADRRKIEAAIHSLDTLGDMLQGEVSN